ncbi:phenylacetate-CoA oxygenase subunit PaaI [Natrialba chahannaoensis JCM 10990]|uniref:Phenylacetate-CoA oxygenase subunit PaaI n=1 Tax=Natrialba chahannaoensis JCM 10990 TaxID=1227492 RepID=M0B5Y2_9EURY|nr:1,2-phenylacetyl-CoA epoxidase subunit PaaC [Natrialba chahannaoensis]ELZ05673.1 phenylacetate-CoA oxygenase subunit PaaI [Natrialba chahannaoensis JCM 10990]
MTTPDFSDPENLTARERQALECLIKRLADDEFVLAERYTEWQVRAPTLESDLALANNAQDELGHARLWYDVLGDHGYTERELVYERDPAEFRHSTIVELPFEEGDWADAVLRSYLCDVAEELRLEALEASSSPKIANRVAKIQQEESYHREHAQNWLERLAEGEEGHERLQAALDRLFPHALTIFEPCAPPHGENANKTNETSDDEPRATGSDVEADIVDFGLRTATLEELGEEWLAIVVPYLESLDLDVPESGQTGDGEFEFEVTQEMLPDERGRDGIHTDAWVDLYDDFTHTYRELGRSEPTKIMETPE